MGCCFRTLKRPSPRKGPPAPCCFIEYPAPLPGAVLRASWIFHHQVLQVLQVLQVQFSNSGRPILCADDPEATLLKAPWWEKTSRISADKPGPSHRLGWTEAVQLLFGAQWRSGTPHHDSTRFGSDRLAYPKCNALPVAWFPRYRQSHHFRQWHIRQTSLMLGMVLLETSAVLLDKSSSRQWTSLNILAMIHVAHVNHCLSMGTSKETFHDFSMKSGVFPWNWSFFQGKNPRDFHPCFRKWPLPSSNGDRGEPCSFDGHGLSHSLCLWGTQLPKPKNLLRT